MPGMKEIEATNFDYKTFLKNLTSNPGVYQMLGEKGDVLYVGKARNLKKRVSSYFRGNQSIKTTSLIKQTKKVEVIVTNSENEALLLENNLIKKLKPRYNILFRDDKSYPYIFLSDHKEFPRLGFYRGPKRGNGRYFGPYPSALAVRETLNLLQKLFRIRSCEDSFFRNRTRPCLQYQLKRCTAPCVGYIDPMQYQQNVQRAILFLEGKSHAVIEELAKQMEDAAYKLDYEKAALYRDQIAQLRTVLQQQAVTTEGGEVDVIALASDLGRVCVQVLLIRGGRLLGSKSYFPVVPAESGSEEILAAFLSQYYLSQTHGREIPHHIVINAKLVDQDWIATALAEQAGHKVALIFQPHGDRARWLAMAQQNAKQALTTHLAERATVFQQLEAVQELLSLDSIPKRLECFDVSHSQGEATVASCVVFNEQGLYKNDYRRFNIEGVTPGDDYGALYQALLRHFRPLKTNEDKLPDILIIDGGKGQLRQAELVLEELQISGITVLGIAKGPGRKAGLETLFISGRPEPLMPAADSLAFHVIQHLRDEAHRFAITGHRGRRAKHRRESVLENIPGIGPKRRRELLRRFGGLQELKRASIEDLTKVPGIHQDLAARIYQILQDS